MQQNIADAGAAVHPEGGEAAGIVGYDRARGASLVDLNLDGMLDLVEATLRDAANATELPAQNPIQCGSANHHDFEGAKKLAADMLAKRDEWHIIFKDEA